MTVGRCIDFKKKMFEESLCVHFVGRFFLNFSLTEAVNTVFFSVEVSVNVFTLS